MFDKKAIKDKHYGKTFSKQELFQRNFFKINFTSYYYLNIKTTTVSLFDNRKQIKLRNINLPI
ncbi:hypothetical protein LEP1GSC079_3735 [Leptospira interrogans str. FPW1039]|uniref:Uncharacterized protein n=1 Tax=Leptospira interrogans str. FPW1039 TaxID=1193040 RepID=A0A0F6IDP6_LEPIR|nr:hypothetical protein LEP1GSC079_3735 [Leptospira interrogans str. FPW1039]